MRSRGLATGRSFRGSLRPRRWGVLALLASLIHIASFDIRRQPILSDVGIYLYHAFRAASGDVLYRDYFDYKTPFSTLLGAFLYRTGESVGVEPLLVIRIGFLLLAAIMMTLSFLVFFHLFRGRAGAGWIALIVLSGFSLLGLLPAIGIIPKLAAMVFALAAILAVHHQRWILVGVFVTLAGADWQIAAGLSLVAVLAGLAASETDRGKATGRLLVGMIMAAAPFLVYFGAHGALDEAWRAVVGSAISRGSQSLQAIGIWQRFTEAILPTTLADGEGGEWALVLSVAGMLLLPFTLLSRRGDRTFPLATSLTVWLYGVVGFSLLDFQFHGDAYFLLGALGLFAALPVCIFYYSARKAIGLRRRALSPRGRRLATRTLSAALGAALLTLARPSFLAGELRVNRPPLFGARYTLADQREVSDRFFARLGDGEAVFFAKWENLFLGRRIDPLPFVTWDFATDSFFSATSEGDIFTHLVEILDRLGPDVVVPRQNDLRRPEGAPLLCWLRQSYVEDRLLSGGGYRLIFWVRKGEGRSGSDRNGNGD
ncbi:MAG: hypothetical protein ABIK65_05385 [Candidatus Eisenbacteria bacterium]